MNAIKPDPDAELAAVQAKLDKTQRDLDQQRAWRHDLERELAELRRERDELRAELFAARDKVARYERLREWANGEIEVSR